MHSYVVRGMLSGGYRVVCEFILSFFYPISTVIYSRLLKVRIEIFKIFPVILGLFFVSQKLSLSHIK